MTTTPNPQPSTRVARILLVDDHPLIREGLARLISRQQDMEVCAEATNAHEALQVAAAHKPEVAIIDLTLGEDDGMDLVKDFRIRFPDIKPLVLSVHDENFYAERALRAGAVGYIMKQERLQTVVEAIRKALQGEVYLSPHMTARTMRLYSGRARPEDTSPIDALSDRAFQIFRLIGEGLGPTDIARRLHISVKTVETHREHIKTKLNIDDATMLRQCAIQWVQKHLSDGAKPS
jgi:DNA-binding NarL/FixJ family response regulator